MSTVWILRNNTDYEWEAVFSTLNKSKTYFLNHRARPFLGESDRWNLEDPDDEEFYRLLDACNWSIKSRTMDPE